MSHGPFGQSDVECVRQRRRLTIDPIKSVRHEVEIGTSRIQEALPARVYPAIAGTSLRHIFNELIKVDIVRGFVEKNDVGLKRQNTLPQEFYQIIYFESMMSGIDDLYGLPGKLFV